MAITINTTPGGASSNSYASVEQANAYNSGHVSGAAWDDATTDQKNRALVTATRLLDEHVEWKGEVATDEQRLLWPRSGMYSEGGVEIAADELPAKLVEATAELARQLLASDRTADDDVATKGVTRLRAGSVDMSFSGLKTPNVIPDAVYFMVRTWGETRRRSQTSVKLVRS